LSNTEKFLELLYSGLVPPGMVVVTMPAHSSPNTFDSTLDELILRTEFCKQYLIDAYIGIAARNSATDTKKGFQATNTIWADIDKPDNFREPILPPSIIIDSGSEGHKHLYWLLDEPLTDPDLLRQVLRVNTKAIGADLQSNDVVHRLRLPGTINTKTGKYHPSRYYIVEIVSDSKAKILEESGITGNWFTTRKRLVRRIITLSRKV
jgi:hypothetical protein